MSSDHSSPAPRATMLHTCKDGTKLIHYTDKELCQENYDLIAKVIWMINQYPGWNEDGTFTFPDGETWARLEEAEDESE